MSGTLPSRSSPPTVAVVNDDPTLLHVLSGLLRKEGLQVHPYPGAEAALQSFATHGPPDLIVTDLFMPTIDGWKFCRLLRSPDYAALNPVPILVVSATFSGEEADQIATRLGANAFLSASVDLGSVADMAWALLRAESARPRRRVLIVDDDLALTTLLRIAYERAGCEPAVAPTCAEGRRLFQEAACEVVVLDYHLPDGDGDELLGEFRRQRPDCVFLMMTGDSNPDLAVRWMKAGASAYLRKPFVPDYLLELQDHTLRERQLLRVEERLEERTRELRHAAARLKLLFDESRDGIVVLDESGRVCEANRRYAEMLGYAPAEMPRLHLWDLDGDHDRQSLLEMLATVDAAGRHFETRHRRKDGSRFDVEISINGVSMGGRKLVFCICRDITARKGLETQLRQAQKMEAVGQLAGGIAHDFNNVLAAMLMRLELLRVQSAAEGPARQALMELENQARRAASLTRQLLAFSRRSIMQVRPTNLNTTVERFLSMLRRLLGEPVRLEFQPAERLPLVEADPALMEQVLVNLCVNARDAMPQGGRLIISTGKAVLDAEQARANPEARPGQHVWLEVADTGCGMDQATLGRIFEPFFTTKEVGKGTGLGLATVYGIVKQLRGWVEVHSQVGVGSSFRVVLPVSERTHEAAPAAPPSPDPGGRERLLLVEDEPEVRLPMAVYLRWLGYQVWEAGNGPEALAVWQERGSEIDLVLTDMVMPGGMTGLELAHKLRAEKPGLKVIVISGYAPGISLGALTPEAGIAFLPKPCEPATLSRTLRDCLDGEAGRTAPPGGG